MWLRHARHHSGQSAGRFGKQPRVASWVEAYVLVSPTITGGHYSVPAESSREAQHGLPRFFHHSGFIKNRRLTRISSQFGSWFSCTEGFREILRFASARGLGASAQNDSLRQCVILRGAWCLEESLFGLEKEELFLADVIAACEECGLKDGLVVNRDHPLSIVFGHDPGEKSFAIWCIFAVSRPCPGHLPIDIHGGGVRA